ncbi:glycosyltransferase [Paenibacillus flagellatus]|uniref:4,4'-diaponeurosporenoate glycosyltransferase n=1 Tax=Paenibacillus flagellatus TaxID=2211139 RepID=A0A2V5K510_9BACL|nr:glycosyltransferase [Paenibacillus flagellatus]PYI52994.1 glycosyl transferase family 2 [Paenibacillus flagellatus]
MRLLELLAYATLVYWLATLAAALGGLRRIPALPPARELRRDPPLVSVIIAAKEEEAAIADTVRSLLQQDYPRFEIIAVNDRSADATGRRLDELKRWTERLPSARVPLRVVHVTSLPEGWLGKNHALYQGYKQAKGSYLLFTDADISFRPNTIRDAVAYMESADADHLTLAPLMTAKSFWLRAFVHYFMFSLLLYLRLWRANDDRQHRFGTGIGAFNLVTRKAYEAIGTHRAIAMRPDDDLQLGQLIKRARFKQRIAVGKRHLEVEWYPSLRAAVHGLEKNLFSGFGYRLSSAIAGMIGQLIAFFGPFAGLLLLPRPSGIASAASAGILIGLYVSATRRLSRDTGIDACALPAAVWMLVAVLARSVALTIRRGGVYWRGTFYPLERLRRK